MLHGMAIAAAMIVRSLANPDQNPYHFPVVSSMPMKCRRLFQKFMSRFPFQGPCLLRLTLPGHDLPPGDHPGRVRQYCMPAMRQVNPDHQAANNHILVGAEKPAQLVRAETV